MDLYEALIEKLNELGIAFELVEHPPALTTEQADGYIKGVAGVRTKSMFLTNQKKTAYYLLIMDDKKRLDMRHFAEITGEKHIKMASLDSLMDKMKLPAGTVSVFGLLNNSEHDVQLYFDHDIMTETRMSFHPNVNTKTIFLSTGDVLKFVESLGFEYVVVDL